MRLIIIFIISSLLTIVFFSAVVGLIMRKFTTGPKLVLFTVGIAFAISVAFRLLDRAYFDAGTTFSFVFQDLIAAILVGMLWLIIQRRRRSEHD